MRLERLSTAAMSILLSATLYAANPFLDAADDQPVSAKFKGTEWGGNIDEEDDQIVLSARVVTTRVATMPWGAIFKIEFVDLKSRAREQREIPPEYFIVTDDRIVLLNEEKMEEAIARIAALPEPPVFEPGDIYGIIKGKMNHQENLWNATIELKGELCVYEAAHPSGHFKKVVWKKGVGLVEYSSGYGAMADGFRLKRTGGAPKKP
jgi:hypothetical protein